MTTTKKIGIWMDHASAHLMEFTADPMKTITIESKFTHQEKEHSLTKGENLMHNKEQHQQSDYYHQVGEAIKNYDEVILYGPTDAKLELFNMLRDDHHFEKVLIDTKTTDKMNEKEQQVFVKQYFTKK